ncbi:Hypothetical Protein FCC1311_045212 [Hondaea fermentalgiana]|uniref:Uncharacterized protein n=1 Tax=Hondaea fermentalgiana TaxID=2315210 RepID=A0A2R5GEZ4_9STRA|nr:Hypothetical Protein FCC1311_045212 [Hondaea fermentalgiana]|eukprot:GBG28298.1 Hypothetical Protein FCC1311_045212 [Hondaea fermentalgiana]
MGDNAPSASDLEAAKLNKVTTSEATGEPSEEEMAGFKKIWDDADGDFETVKGLDAFKGSKWHHNFEPKSAEDFAKGVLKGLAFED